VLDAEGRIRFESHVNDDVIRQVFVLRHRSGASPGHEY